MIKKLLQWLYCWACVRDTLMGKTEKIIKICTAGLLFGISAAFALDALNVWDLSDFQQFSQFDAWFWVALTAFQAALQIALLRYPHRLAHRAWSSVSLQFSGLSLMVAGGMFWAKYPPFHLPMAVFPLIGFCILMAGRSLNKRARQKMEGR